MLRLPCKIELWIYFPEVSAQSHPLHLLLHICPLPSHKIRRRATAVEKFRECVQLGLGQHEMMRGGARCTRILPLLKPTRVCKQQQVFVSRRDQVSVPVSQRRCETHDVFGMSGCSYATALQLHDDLGPAPVTRAVHRSWCEYNSVV